VVVSPPVHQEVLFRHHREVVVSPPVHQEVLFRRHRGEVLFRRHRGEVLVEQHLYSQSDLGLERNHC